jgi:glycosyltransferase involved in cell wall biosynthesis
MDAPLAQNKDLYIFNLETNLDNPALAFTHDWITEFSKYYKRIFVYSFKVGRISLPPNVSVYELGSFSTLNRIKNVFIHFFILLKIALSRNKIQVFYHMNARSAMLIGLPLKLFRINQILWYSHSTISKSLRLATLFVNGIVSTSMSSFPISTKKLHCTGHGVLFPDISRSFARGNSKIVVLGRVSRSKRIHELIPEIAKFNLGHVSTHLSLDILGPTLTSEDLHYQEELLRLADLYKVSIEIKGSIPKTEIYEKLSNYSIAYNGMVGTIDKAAIESAYAGCYLVSDQGETLDQCGFHFENQPEGTNLPSISEQLESIFNMSENSLVQKKLSAIEYVIKNHSLNNTIAKIVLLLMKKNPKN